ncbi:MFS family permease [Streptomyces sp. SAI-149]|nr:MFS family permease [Streptomyces sp. SAI-149]
MVDAFEDVVGDRNSRFSQRLCEGVSLIAQQVVLGGDDQGGEPVQLIGDRLADRGVAPDADALVGGRLPGGVVDLVRRVGMKATMTAGLLLLSAGLFVISLLDVDSGYLPFLGGLVLAGFGIGLSGSVGTAAITGSLGRGQQGVASAMNDTTREVGSAVGIALMGSIYGSHYRSNLPDSLDQLPAEAADAARDSAAAGLHVADQLGAQGAALADGVKAAFMDGLSASLIAVSIIVLAAAIGCLLRAPKTPPTSD